MHKRPEDNVAGKLEMVTYMFPPWHRENATSKQCKQTYVVNCFSHCTHLLQSAQLRLRRTVCQCVLSACFRTPRLSLGHPGSLTSVHDLKCMRTQTAPLFNVPRGRRGTTTRVVHPYPCGTSRAGNRTRVVAWGVQSVNHYTTGPAPSAVIRLNISFDSV